MDETLQVPPPAPPPAPKTGWWRSLDRASRIALGVAVGLLVLAVAVGGYGLSRLNHSSSVNMTATRRMGPNGFRFRGGPGGGGGVMRDIRTQALSTAAKTIGISETDLQNEVVSGKSIADVAKAHNVDPQKVIDAIVSAEKTQIDKGVTSGTIPQAVATRVEANLEQTVAARVYATGGRMRVGGPMSQ